MPLGISFFTLTQVAYLVDCHRGEVTGGRSFIHYALFVSFFPHLLAGPILYHGDMMRQFADQALRRVNWDNMARGWGGPSGECAECLNGTHGDGRRQWSITTRALGTLGRAKFGTKCYVCVPGGTRSEGTKGDGDGHTTSCAPAVVVAFREVSYRHSEPNQHFIKMRYLLANPTKYDAYAFGSSRVGNIDLAKINNGRQWYNMTYSDGLPAEWIADIKLMLARGVQVKELLIALDDRSYQMLPESHLHDYMRLPYREDELLRTYMVYLLKRPSGHDKAIL